MARIRTIKPGAFTSESLAAVSVEARWTFAGLWTYVDDEGRGKSDPRLIKAHVWPLDDAVTVDDVCRFLDELEKEHTIQRYRVDGRDYLAVVNWREHQYIQRPKASKLPAPDGSCTEPANQLDESVIDHVHVTDESRQEGKGKEGNRDTSSPEPMTARSILFDEFWSAYPRKVGKADAMRVWQSVVKKVNPTVVQAGAVRYRDDPNREDQFTAHASTWLRRGGWDDEPLPARGPQLAKAGDGTPAWRQDPTW